MNKASFGYIFDSEFFCNRVYVERGRDNGYFLFICFMQDIFDEIHTGAFFRGICFHLQIGEYKIKVVIRMGINCFDSFLCAHGCCIGKVIKILGQN